MNEHQQNTSAESPARNSQITKLKKPEAIVLSITLLMALLFGISIPFINQWSFVSESINLSSILLAAVVASVPALIYLLKHQSVMSTLLGIVVLHFCILFASLLMLSKLVVVAFGEDVEVNYFLDKSTKYQRAWRPMQAGYADIIYGPEMFRNNQQLIAGGIVPVMIREGWLNQKLISVSEMQRVEDSYAFVKKQDKNDEPKQEN